MPIMFIRAAVSLLSSTTVKFFPLLFFSFIFPVFRTGAEFFLSAFRNGKANLQEIPSKRWRISLLFHGSEMTETGPDLAHQIPFFPWL